MEQFRSIYLSLIYLSILSSFSYPSIRFINLQTFKRLLKRFAKLSNRALILLLYIQFKFQFCILYASLTQIQLKKWNWINSILNGSSLVRLCLLPYYAVCKCSCSMDVACLGMYLYTTHLHTSNFINGWEVNSSWNSTLWKYESRRSSCDFWTSKAFPGGNSLEICTFKWCLK